MRNYNRENLILNVNTFGSSKSINFVKIENLRFFSNINKHSKIKMSFLFEAEDKKVLDMVIKDSKAKIAVYFSENKENYCFFEGYALSIRVTKLTENLFQCKLLGISATIDLDRNYISKVYQNSNYEIFYNDIKEETEKIYINDEVLREKLEPIIVRYKETPWEICMRLASYRKTVLYPRLSNVMLGSSNIVSEYVLEKDFSIISESVYRDGADILLKINIEAKALFLIGDKVSISDNDVNKSFIVIGSYISLDNNCNKIDKRSGNGDFILNYVLADEKWEYKKRIYNKNLKSLILHAKITENNVYGDIAKAKVLFYENLEYKYNDFGSNEQLNEEYYEIPYLTPYSKDKSEMFVAPEIEDNILIGFKNEKEESIYIFGSAYNEKNERFINNIYRNYFTENSSFVFDSENAKIIMEAGEIYKENSDVCKLLADDVIIETNRLDGIL